MLSEGREAQVAGLCKGPEVVLCLVFLRKSGVSGTG